MNSNNNFSIVFNNAHPFKVIIEMIKNVLQGVNIEILYKQQEECVEGPFTGIRIDTLDNINTVYVKLLLFNNEIEFDEFKVSSDKGYIDIGVNLTDLYNIVLKNIKNGDKLKLQLDNITGNLIGTNIGKKSRIEQSTLNTLQIDDPKKAFKYCDYDTFITINTNEIQQMCKNIQFVENKVEITVDKDKVVFQMIGDRGKKEMTFFNGSMEDMAQDPSIVIIQKNDKPVHGIFMLTNLETFTKCNGLCSDVTLKMSSKINNPLCMEYTFTNLGTMYIYLMQLQHQEQINTNQKVYQNQMDDEDLAFSDFSDE